MLTNRKESNNNKHEGKKREGKRKEERRKEEPNQSKAIIYKKHEAPELCSLSHSYGYILPTWWVDYSTNQPHCTQSNQAQWYAYLLLCNLYLIGRSGNLNLYTINVVYNINLN